MCLYGERVGFFSHFFIQPELFFCDGIIFNLKKIFKWNKFEVPHFSNNRKMCIDKHSCR